MTPIIGRSATTVVSSWIDMLAGLSMMYCLRMPPLFWAAAGQPMLSAERTKVTLMSRSMYRAIAASSRGAAGCFARLARFSLPRRVADYPSGRGASLARRGERGSVGHASAETQRRRAELAVQWRCALLPTPWSSQISSNRAAL